MKPLGNDWDIVLKDVFESENIKKLKEFLINEYNNYTVFPPMRDIFNCFRYTPYESVKCVILGQDPYPGRGQAHGLCFSVQEGNIVPRSLANIYKEIYDDLGIKEPVNYGCLTSWAERGVLLMNTVMTVREGKPNSHKNCGWEWFTDEVIKKLSDRDTPMVFMLWGSNARSKKKLINTRRHLVLECNHPSPLVTNSSFFGSKHFSKCNEFLKRNGIEPIDWQI